eukprot:COSAG05_NODE_1880_length_3909_cov_1.531234_7_plen_167_part_00
MLKAQHWEAVKEAQSLRAELETVRRAAVPTDGATAQVGRPIDRWRYAFQPCMTEILPTVSLRAFVRLMALFLTPCVGGGGGREEQTPRAGQPRDEAAYCNDAGPCCPLSSVPSLNIASFGDTINHARLGFPLHPEMKCCARACTAAGESRSGDCGTTGACTINNHA